LIMNEPVKSQLVTIYVKKLFSLYTV